MTEQVHGFKNAKECLKYLNESGISFVNFIFSDINGKLQQTTYIVNKVDEDMLTHGVYFDGSSITAWKSIHESDMNMRPDLSRCFYDPYAASPTMNIFCDIYDPIDGKPYERDPRSIAKAAEKYLKDYGVADSALFGPEPEFMIFNDVRFGSDMNQAFYSLDSDEGPYNSDAEFENGNLGHRPGVKGGYFPMPPIDSLSDVRSQMLHDLTTVGVDVEKHHHEVAPSQCEIGFNADTLLKTADNLQALKYVVHNTAQGFGMSATFMPKPIFGDNGSGMHVHQSLTKGGKPIFAGDGYAGLSDTCLYYIGGIIKHAKALNAFTNPTTNSYKRLVPGYEAPVIVAYSARNRSAACRIPMATSPKGKRVEIRFPDPTANPYLAFAAMLMAGLDGIKNKIHPGEPSDRDLYTATEDELAQMPHVAGSLNEALNALEKDHAFLTEGNVFTEDMIKAFIKLKREDVDMLRLRPHPIEFEKYYSS